MSFLFFLKAALKPTEQGEYHKLLVMSFWCHAENFSGHQGEDWGKENPNIELVKV